ncbi:MAG: BatA domain-containing protein, partial [Candidatus Cloacimonetes bacterium]|nr:BatA domain-containing protein [Candidatus Cloacimonadota bacterium]
MFGLSFLNSGILFLASAGIIPLLIYLFAKKKPRKIIFSTIKFIKESQKKQRKRINIKNLLLLIIRILIIILTIFAISRPSIKAPFINTGTLHPKTAIAVIIDNSYSMDYLVDTQTELEKAKEIAFNINNIISKD